MKKNNVRIFWNLRIMVLIVLFLILCLGVFQCQASESEKFSARIIDNSNTTIYVYDLHLAKYISGGWVSDPAIRWVGGHYQIEKDMLIKVGDIELTIPFEKIKEIDFEWHETPICAIISNENEGISGKPLRTADWYLKGETNFGDFSLDANKVKKVIFRPTQIGIHGFTIENIEKSSETAPEINIAPIKKQKLSNTTVLLSGSALSDSGIESVTINGQDAGTEYWSAPLDLSLGDNNIVIVAKGNDGSTTVENISLAAFITSSTHEPESWISKNIVSLLILLLGTGLITAIIKRYIKRRHS